MSRNKHAHADLAAVLEVMNPEKKYALSEIYALAISMGIKTGFSTIGKWLEKVADSEKVIRVSRGLYQKIRPIPISTTQGILPLEPSQDITAQAILRLESKIDALLLAMRISA